MLPLNEVNISSRKLFNTYTVGIPVSFYNFSNIFMWRKVNNYRYALIDGALCVFSKYRDEPPFAFYPLGCDIDTVSVISKMKDYTENGKLLLRPLTDKMVSDLVCLYPNVTPYPHRELSDYIYKTSDLVELKGQKFHQKRNHINNFIQKYNYDYISITPGNIDLLMNASKTLFTEYDNRDLADEYDAINELIANFSVLELRAGVIMVDENIVAYSIGERLNSNTAIIHTEKADRNYEGSYTMINHEFLAAEFSDTEYVNREEDMGIVGLRRAKLSYNPVSLTNIYTISLKNEEEFYHVESCNVKQMACTCRGICQSVVTKR